MFVPDNAGPRPVLCICHGLPQGPHDPADLGYQLLAKRFALNGFLTIIFNFRGVGESEGNLDIRGWCRDLTAVIDKAACLPGADTARMNLLGFSAGAAVSIIVAASDKRVAAVASCASPAKFTFLREEDAARRFVEHLRSIALIRDASFPSDLTEWMEGWSRVCPAESIGSIAPAAILLMHGDQDEVVPLRNAHMLFARAGEPKQLMVMPGLGHRMRLDAEAMDAVLAWLKRVNGIR